MRALGAGLLAFAAIAASLSYARQRPGQRYTPSIGAVPDGAPAVAANLEAIRAAGF